MIIEAMGQALTGLSHVPTTADSFTDNAIALSRIAGSGREAARQLGIAESTLRGWRHGVRPRNTSSVNQDLVATARQLAAHQTGELARVRQDPTANGHAITGVVVASKDIRRRTIYPGRQIPATTMRRILTRWANGEDDSKVEASLVRAIETYYAPLGFVHIEAVSFE